MAQDVTPAPRTGLSRGLKAFIALDVVLVLAFIAVLASVLAGRGGPEPEAGSTATATATPQAETTPEPTAPAEPETPQNLTDFVLPSGNIVCTMSETAATCTILEFSYEPPPPPEGCPGPVGSTLTVNAEGAGFVCPQAEPVPAAETTPVLEYGEGSTLGDITCLSSQNGVFCRHDPSGAGFSLARAGTQLF